MARPAKPYRIWKRQDRGGVYYYRLPGAAWITTGKTARGRAEAIAAEAYAAHVANNADIGAKPDTLRDYANTFFVFDQCEYIARQAEKGRPISAITASRRRAHLVNHIFPKWGSTPLYQLNPVQVENWLASLPLANRTRNDILETLTTITGEAERERAIGHDPLSKIERMGTDYRVKGIFTHADLLLLFPDDELELLRIWRTDAWATMHFLMLTTGMRCQEVGALTWRDIIWPDGVLIVRAIKGDGSIGETKGRWKRAAIMPPRTAEMLRWIQRDTDLVFPGRDGHFDSRTLYRQVGGALGHAGVEPGERWLTAHSFRHTWRTMMEAWIIKQQLDGAAIDYMMGHKTEAVVRRYIHLDPADVLEQLPRKQIEGAWG